MIIFSLDQCLRQHRFHRYLAVCKQAGLFEVCQLPCRNKHAGNAKKRSADGQTSHIPNVDHRYGIFKHAANGLQTKLAQFLQLLYYFLKNNNLIIA